MRVGAVISGVALDLADLDHFGVGRTMAETLDEDRDESTTLSRL